MPSGFICHKCGVMEKSGKASCCGRGGSWFRNCGSGGSKKYRHTWYEGMLACKTQAQLETVRPRQPNGAQPLRFSSGFDVVNSKAVITAPETSPASIPTPMKIINASVTTASRKYGTGITSSKATTPVTTSDNYPITQASRTNIPTIILMTRAHTNT